MIESEVKTKFLLGNSNLNNSSTFNKKKKKKNLLVS